MLKTNKIYNMDCLKGMELIENGSVDLILTDPPYNIKGGGQVSTYWRKNKYHSIREDWDKNFDIDFFDIAWEKLKNNGSMLVFCSIHLLGKYLNHMQPKQILHWIKSDPLPAISKVYTPSVEYILWFVKGSPYTFNKKYAKKNIILNTACRGKERTKHKAQKPLKIIESLISVHSNVGDLIFDPFIGSGTTAIASHNLKRNYIGFEWNPEEPHDLWYKLAIERVKYSTNQLSVLELVGD